MTIIWDQPIFLQAIRFSLDVFAVFVLMRLYYHRYGDKELVISAALFNFFAFAVLSILSSVQFGVNAGFGLFAILALFTLRSEQISKTEITYFFGSLGLAIISSLHGTELSSVIIGVTVVVLAAFIVDHPKILPSVSGIRITLDKIDDYALSDPAKFRAELSVRLAVDVISYQIKTIDYINDMVTINVNYRKI